MQSIRRKREKGIGDSTSAIEFPYSGALYVASLSEDVLRADEKYRYLKVHVFAGASAADQLQTRQSMRYLSCIAVCIMKNTVY